MEKIDLKYGYVVIRPEISVKLTCPELTTWKKIEKSFIEGIDFMISPLLLALSVTCFAYVAHSIK